MTSVKAGGDIKIHTPACFALGLTLDCGQAFRWTENPDGSFSGVAGGRFLRIKQDVDTLTFFDTAEGDFNSFWRGYFDLERDYSAIVASYECDKQLSRACREGYGIRILRQEPWEALCSFIISANNNIPRIKGIISRLCESFGTRLTEGAYTFPAPERLASLSPGELDVIRAGFRNRYIIDAAQKVSSGGVSLERIAAADFEDAKKELLTVKGVGEKVAQCTLLYGFNRLEAFPVDVWIRRVINELYPAGLPECIRGTEGIAQQYLFNYMRTNYKEEKQ